MKMHYGQITESMRVNYYRLDIGTKAFSAIPDGERLIERLVAVMNSHFISVFKKHTDTTPLQYKRRQYWYWRMLCFTIQHAMENEVVRAHGKFRK